MSARGAHFFKGLREGALIRGRRSFEGGAHSFDDRMVKFVKKYLRISTVISFEMTIFKIYDQPNYSSWCEYSCTVVGNRGLPDPILTNKNRGLDNNWLNEKIQKSLEGGGRSFEGGAH